MFLFRQLLKWAESKCTVTWEINKGIIYIGIETKYRNCFQKKTIENEIENHNFLIVFRTSSKKLPLHSRMVEKTLQRKLPGLIT